MVTTTLYMVRDRGNPYEDCTGDPLRLFEERAAAEAYAEREGGWVDEWTVAARLPLWNEMTDLDKGAVLLHLRKRERDGGEYAESHYPAHYFDHPALTALSPLEASRHAASFGTAQDRFLALGEAEHDRLYDLASRLRTAW